MVLIKARISYLIPDLIHSFFYLGLPGILLGLRWIWTQSWKRCVCGVGTHPVQDASHTLILI